MKSLTHLNVHQMYMIVTLNTRFQIEAFRNILKLFGAVAEPSAHLLQQRRRGSL